MQITVDRRNNKIVSFIPILDNQNYDIYYIDKLPEINNDHEYEYHNGNIVDIGKKDKTVEQLKSQIQALTEEQEFLTDTMTEMILAMYAE